MDSSTTSRLAGLGGILFVVTAFLGLGGPYFDDPSNEEILSWVRANPVGLCVQGLQIGIGLTLIAALVAQLVLRSGRRGPLAIVAIATIAADLAVDWVSAAVNFALADSGKRAGADDAVLALFSLSKEMTFADGFLFGLAVTAVSALSLRARFTPGPARVAGRRGRRTSPGRPAGPADAQRHSRGCDGSAASVVTGLFWVLSTALLAGGPPACGRPATRGGAGPRLAIAQPRRAPTLCTTER